MSYRARLRSADGHEITTDFDSIYNTVDHDGVFYVFRAQVGGVLLYQEHPAADAAPAPAPLKAVRTAAGDRVTRLTCNPNDADRAREAARLLGLELRPCAATESGIAYLDSPRWPPSCPDGEKPETD